MGRLRRLGEGGGRWQVKRNLLSSHGEKWVRYRHHCVPIWASVARMSAAISRVASTPILDFAFAHPGCD